jgi:hypothetical protein
MDLSGNLRATFSGSITANTSANATAAAPSYTEGTENPLSQNLTGDLRTISKQSGAWTMSGTGTAGSAAAGVMTVQGIAAMTPLLVTLGAETTKVIGTVNQGTSPWVVSLTSTTITGTVAATQSGTWNITNISGTISLPTGASTAAKQPALGTAGTPSADVITVQGAASATPLLTARAPVSTAALGIVPVVSSALETGHVIKASAGNLYGLNVSTTTVGGFVQIFNSTTVPAAGAVTPIRAYAVPANSTLVIGFDPPLQCGTGISVAFSSATTPFTKTDSATAFISGDAV